MDNETRWQEQVQWLTASVCHAMDAMVLLSVEAEQQATQPPLALRKFLGRSSLQRALYYLARAGVRCCALVCEQEAAEFDQLLKPQVAEIDLGDMGVCLIKVPLENLPKHALADRATVVQANFVFDYRLLEKIFANGMPARLVSPRGEVLGIAKLESQDVRLLLHHGHLQSHTGSVQTPQDIRTDGVPAYLPSMRRSFAPYWLYIEHEQDLDTAADRVMDSAQKGVLDFPARYLHPIPENWLARLFAKTSITPNQITIFSAVLAFMGTYWFATQQYSAALFMAVLAGILDGVDGKLARIKLLSSPFGDRLDHTLDVSFEFSWYIAIGWGLYQSSGEWSLFGYGLLIVVIMLLARSLSGLYLLQTGHQIHDHTAFDRAVRLFAGRRNIYVLLLVAGYLTDNFLMSFYLIIVWGIATVAIYAGRNILVFARRVLPV